MPGKHTAKQKRQAKHIAASERKRGKSAKEAESIGWATVNAEKSMVMTLDQALLLKNMGEVKPQVSATPPNRRRAPKQTVKMKPISNQEAMQNLRAGKFHEKSLNITLKDLDKALRKMKKRKMKKDVTEYGVMPSTTIKKTKKAFY